MLLTCFPPENVDWLFLIFDLFEQAAELFTALNSPQVLEGYPPDTNYQSIA
jgi:hypothetical protein